MFEPMEQGKDLSIHTGVVLRGASTKEDEHLTGTLNIVEYSFGKCIEWKPIEVSVVSENQDQDPEWSLVNTHTSRTRTSSEGPDSLGRRIVRILFSELQSIRVNSNGQLIFMQKDGTTYVAFFQLQNAGSFLNSLKGFMKFIRSKQDKSLYLVVDDLGSVLNKSFAELDIFQENKSDHVWNFVKNLHDNPYETTMEAFSKLADVWLYKEPVKRPVEEAVADLLNRSLTVSLSQPPVSVGSGEEYEVIGESSPRMKLPPRPSCSRGTPLSQEQWDDSKDIDGRINEPEVIRGIIFKGGISPSLRYEVWKFLLNYYPWNSTESDRSELRKKKTDEYYAMKLQWKSMTSAQESRFSEYRDRKSLIEKDVNRTDRTHAYYSGDNNPHLGQLYDILMTYVMFNFDLGYVQGMSDLLSPILCLMDNEVDAFWCFVGFMEKVSSNFEMDQAGMKLQLCQLHDILAVTEPQLAQYLNKHDSGNMFFCFRWLLVLFKREFNTVDIMKLWEILWTDLPCRNFHLLFCVAILETEKAILMENRYGFTEILKHINDLSLHIELHWTLSKAEGIYHQLMTVAQQLPDNVRAIIGLEPARKSPEINNQDDTDMSNGVVKSEVDTSPMSSTDEVDCVKIGSSEVAFERSLNLNYM
ncbi:hypothetical protein QAD02_012523 [Eretmocerus hayati]|uniref:Uncharacterized protein n=1 Tax=Eretmocerus hayati TaxID=131215 RepID=A0ACC2P1M3_9HYME|nr:hypothetical protein QAD02_012523 [Eretmocerus hayati]